jgi:gliding motility-associated-like protein
MRKFFFKSLISAFFVLNIGLTPGKAQLTTSIPVFESCPGQIISVPVLFENLLLLDSFQIVFSYDPAVLEYRGFENINPAFSGPGFTIQHTPGLISMTFTTTTAISPADGSIASFRFQPGKGFSDFIFDESLCGYFLDDNPLENQVYENGRVDILPEFYIDLEQFPEEVCPGTTDASIFATIRGGVPPYEFDWSVSPQQVLSGDSIIINLETDQQYFLRLTDALGCVKDTSFKVKTRILNTIQITAVPDTVYLPNPTVVFSAENQSDPFIRSYKWVFGDGDSTVTFTPSVSHIYREAKFFNEQGGQKYELKLTIINEFDCDTTYVYEIPINEAKIFVPNVFTPNGDGANDEFRIVREDDKDKVIKEEYLRLELVVYNRWGNRIVFESENYQSDWDGGNAPDGVYLYVLRAIGFYKQDIHKGAVHIFR